MSMLPDLINLVFHGHCTVQLFHLHIVVLPEASLMYVLFYICLIYLGICSALTTVGFPCLWASEESIWHETESY